MQKIAYLAIDVHARNCVLGHMNVKGEFLGTKTFPTSEKNMIDAVKSIPAKEKYLTFEEGNLAYWAAQVISPYVMEVISCDPKENALIYRGPNKRDKIDTKKLCRQLPEEEPRDISLNTY